MKNLTFNEKINLFLENKAKETLAMSMKESVNAHSFLLVYAGLILCMHNLFQKLNKENFIH